jgi:transcriptional regulator with XRE-family HTH domain
MDAKNPRELGAIIRQTRIERGLTQKALADLVGDYQPVISAVEKGHTGVRISLIFQIIKALGLSMQLEGSGSKKRSPPPAADDDDAFDLDAIANTGLKK